MNNAEKDIFVGKGGKKLQFALEYFNIRVADLTTADLGCHIGGFTDCLLSKGAKKVFAVDTAYGIFAWKLRNDPRVMLFERTNALYWNPPEKVDLVVIDLGWTRQSKSLPLAGKILNVGGEVLSLVKPQYEAPREWLEKGILPEQKVVEALNRTRQLIPSDLRFIAEAKSPYLGGGGNCEYWWWLKKEATF